MYCPKCKEYGTKVIDSRMYPGEVNKRWRKHECPNCGYRFYTTESVSDDTHLPELQFDRIAYRNGLKIKREKEKEKENGQRG